MPTEDEPRYRLEMVARMLNIRPETIRRYERRGLVSSARLRRERLYSERAVLRLKRIALVTELGVNLAGAEVICNLLDRMEEQHNELQAVREQLRRLLEE